MGRMVFPSPRYTKPDTMVEIKHPSEDIKIFPNPMKPKMMKKGGMVISDMRNLKMGSHKPFSMPIGSLCFEQGGKVPYTPPVKTVLAEIPTSGVDRVPALLAPNEIVIPTKYADKVNKFLKRNGIHLPNC